MTARALTVGFAFLALVGGALAASAKTINGTTRGDRLVGTARADSIDGRAGNDVLLGLAGSDLLRGGTGRDTLAGGSGADRFAVNGDAARDSVACGAGVDVVNADQADAVARDCEVVSRQISTDTVSGGEGQHATEVEPDSFSFGRTVVAVFQVGRIATGGATAIGFATSSNGGRTWRNGLLPGVTASSPAPGTNPRASDPTVAYDATHGVWLAASLGIGSPFQILVSRSADGVSWSAPVVARASSSLDKEWIACDNWPSSPNRGHCYLSYLEPPGEQIVTQTSTDGGLTWGSAVQTSLPAGPGLEPNGAQPLPRPDGSLVVVYMVTGTNGPTFGDALRAARSDDGGVTFAPGVTVADLSWTDVPRLRTPPLPSADVAADGMLFVAWGDCRPRPPCSRQRILVTSSADGTTWATPTPVSSPALAGQGQFVPGLAVDPAATGPAKRLAVAYYSLSAASLVETWLVTSADSGATWSPPQRLAAQPMRLEWLPSAGGLFLGDYISTSYVTGRPMPVWTLAVQPVSKPFNESIMALQTG